jgi:salicylate hydroxylase
LISDYSSSVGIVGGGIAGLIAGCTLQEEGVKTVIFERSKSLNTDGAGITISPNGLRILQKLQIQDRLIQTSFVPNNILFHQKNRNIAKVVSPENFVTSSRYNLLQILQQKYFDLGGEVLYDHKYKSINQEKIKITFTNNEEYEVRHILACDGINSAIREEYFPLSGPAIYSGYQAWRGIGKAQQSDTKFHFSEGKHIVSYPINDNGEVSFTAVLKNDYSAANSWRIKGSKTELLQDFNEFNKEVFSMLGSSDEIFKWGIYIRPVLKSIYIKNITLLGDAAHPMVPFLGQGGCMAMEDGYTFGRLAGANSDNFSKTQLEFERIRLDRKNMIQAASKTQGKIYHLENPIIVFFRNFLLKHTPVIKLRTQKIWAYKIDNEIEKLIN